MMSRVCSWFAAAFPFWIVLGCAWAWFRPADWIWFKPWIEPGLGLVMLGMDLPIDALGLFRSMLLVVLLPLLVGLLVNTAVGRMKRPEPVRRAVGLLGPVLSVVVIVLIVGCIFALKKAEIAAAAAPLFLSVFLLHASGFGFGYLAMWLAGRDEPMRRTVSIEVGMQNSGLGSALATRHFAEYALAPVPSAISAVYHCLIGSLLAAWWRWRDS